MCTQYLQRFLLGIYRPNAASGGRSVRRSRGGVAVNAHAYDMT